MTKRDTRSTRSRPARATALSRWEVADLFRVSPSTIARWARDGKLPCSVTLGGHRRYNRREILEIIEGLKGRGTAPRSRKANGRRASR